MSNDPKDTEIDWTKLFQPKSVETGGIKMKQISKEDKRICENCSHTVICALKDKYKKLTNIIGEIQEEHCGRSFNVDVSCIHFQRSKPEVNMRSTKNTDSGFKEFNFKDGDYIK